MFWLHVVTPPGIACLVVRFTLWRFYIFNFFVSYLSWISGMSEIPRVAMEQVSKECNSFEASVNLAVWSFLHIIIWCSLFRFPSFLPFLEKLKKSYLLSWLPPYPRCDRFNGHLRKKGISGHIKVSYEDETLSIEVSGLFVMICFCKLNFFLGPSLL